MEILQRYILKSLLITINILFLSISNGQTRVHHNGHSHNDYEQNLPLYHALSLDFLSIEADIYPCQKELKVSHGPFGLKKKQNLHELYLAPLDSIITLNNGTVYPEDSSILKLMIDFKWWKKKSLTLLIDKLDDYKHHLYQKKDGKEKWGPIQIVLSGNPPLDFLSKNHRDYLFIDGRAGQQYPRNLKSYIVLLSSSFGSLINQMHAEDKIIGYIKSCERYGRQVRFWATPDEIETWKLLDRLGAHWIHVDNLEKFVIFRKENPIN